MRCEPVVSIREWGGEPFDPLCSLRVLQSQPAVSDRREANHSWVV